MQYREDALEPLHPLGHLHRRWAQRGDQRPQLPQLAFQADVLVGLRRQEPLGVRGQHLQPGSIGTLCSGDGGLEAMQQRCQRVRLLLHEGTPRGVQGSLRPSIMEATGAGASQELPKK